MHINISQMHTGHAGLLINLWQYYHFDTSAREQLDVNSSGRFDTPEEFFRKALRSEDGNSALLVQSNSVPVGFLILQPAEVEGIPITEFADLFVLPKHRGRGVATAVVERVMISSEKPWLIAIFREDLNAQNFWRSVFKRLPFSSCREIVPPELPEFHEFLVNERDA